ncbi:DUF4249 family protein [Pedobacter hartonius]|uniref:DUF4249 domain-containing protein n=1 Tax=Pedobacter hartonius TaxID=425514 RepID=A0A1H4GZ93_9SPHI|nr:DUF4249 family protein [Pedobacter hartonius]SEB14834.1 protein of unknown function [Pedobacter hartonius]
MVTIINYKKILFSSIVVLLFLAAACKKDNSSADYSSLPVVEAYLMPNKIVEVKVSLQKALVDTNAYGVPISGLTISISDGTTTKVLTEDKTGHYVLNDLSFVKSKGLYSLSFIYNDLPVTASTVVPGKPSDVVTSADTVVIPKMTFGSTATAFVPVFIGWNNSGAYNHIVVFRYLESFKSIISNRFNSDTSTSVEVNAVKTSSFELTARTFKYYGNYKVIVTRVNQEYLDMLNNTSKSSQNLTNAPTNVTNGLGIFTAMQSDTLSKNLLVKAEE